MKKKTIKNRGKRQHASRKSSAVKSMPLWAGNIIRFLSFAWLFE